MFRDISLRSSLILFVALCLTIAVYWPSLHGSFVFDDYPNIVENSRVHMTSLDWTSIHDAALSSPAKDFPRPLAMLSFGLDWFYSGNDHAHRMKVVNLLIHLINGILLFFLTRLIVRLSRAIESTSKLRGDDAVALFVCFAWMLAPINFTAVAYIVQRMESLCNAFVFAGLWAYLSARRRMYLHEHTAILPAIALVVATFFGSLAKESAALLPLYAFIADFCLFKLLKHNGRPDKQILVLFLVVLVIPATFAGAWVTNHYLISNAWASRTFTLWQRVLTEPRIILDYVAWTVLPRPDELALYHDNIVTSKGLLTPVTTIASIVTILTGLVYAFVVRQRRPLIALGIMWFVAAQLLTATVVPLELAFEHRNYFASTGIFLAVFSVLVSNSSKNLKFARRVAGSALVTLFVVVTSLRSMDWENPIAFATSEAAKNPQSPRTMYELGRTYVVLSNYDPTSAFIPLARTTLERASTMPNANGLSDQALLILSGNLKQHTNPETWTQLRQKLVSEPLSAENISALYAITQCAIKQRCAFPPQEVIDTFAVAISQNPNNVKLLSIYANYAGNVLHDFPLALKLVDDSVKLDPKDMQLRLNMLLLLAASGQADQAIAYYKNIGLALPRAMDDKTYIDWGRRLARPVSVEDINLEIPPNL